MTTTTGLGQYRVLDLSTGISGPFAARLFGDYGSDVIKVESPGVGDPSRRLGPFHHDEPHPEKSLSYLYLNNNKRGVTLSLETAQGRQIFKEMLKKADGLIESYDPGYLDSLGLGYEEIEQINPRVVVTSITPFGRSGPYRDFQGNDLLYQAMGGIMYTSGAYGREPLKHGHPQTLWMGGIIAAYATSAALFTAMLNGQGQNIDLSMAEVAASHHYTSSIRYIYNGSIERRAPKIESGSTKGTKFEGIVSAQNGHIGPTFQKGRQRASFAEYVGLLGRADLDDARFATESDRQQHLEELDEILLPVLKEWNKFDYFNTTMSEGFVAAVVQTSEDLVNCPQLAEREYFTEIEHPVIGKTQIPGEVFRLPKAPWSTSRPAPILGQHNEEIYSDLGYSRDDLLQLRRQGVI